MRTTTATVLKESLEQGFNVVSIAGCSHMTKCYIVTYDQACRRYSSFQLLAIRTMVFLTNC